MKKRLTYICVIIIIITVAAFTVLRYGFKPNIENISEASVSLISGVDIEKSAVVSNVAVGSGFFYDKGLILTANHNITDKCFAVAFDGDIYETEVMYSDSTNDIAILKVNTDKYPYLKISKDNIKIGQNVRCICTPKTIFLKNTLLNGKVTNINVNGLSNQYLLQTDLPLSPGCSGSPIINKKGQVIAMNAFKSTEFATESLSYAILGDKLADAVEAFENKKNPIKYNITFVENFNNQYGLLLESGITIDKIEENSVFNGHFFTGDVIKSIGEKEIFTKADFYENFDFGLNISFIRNGKLTDIVIKE